MLLPQDFFILQLKVCTFRLPSRVSRTPHPDLIILIYSNHTKETNHFKAGIDICFCLFLFFFLFFLKKVTQFILLQWNHLKLMDFAWHVEVFTCLQCIIELGFISSKIKAPSQIFRNSPNFVQSRIIFSDILAKYYFTSKFISLRVVL